MPESNVIYKAGEVMTRLGLKESVFKKYISLLEREGYTIQRDSKGHRIYSDADIHMISRFIELAKYDGMTLESTAKQLGEVIRKNKGHEVVTAEESRGNDVMTLAASLLAEQEKMFMAQFHEALQLHEQRAIEREQRLLDRLNKQDEYIHQKLERRDQLLLENIREMQAVKEIAATKEKKWWEFWK